MHNNETSQPKEQRNGLHLQLKIYYDENDIIKEELVPGYFLTPDDLHYGLDQFMEMDVYDMLVDIIYKLKLSAKDQLKITLSALNYLDTSSKYSGSAIRAEVIDLLSGDVVVSSED